VLRCATGLVAGCGPVCCGWRVRVLCCLQALAGFGVLAFPALPGFGLVRGSGFGVRGSGFGVAELSRVAGLRLPGVPVRRSSPVHRSPILAGFRSSPVLRRLAGFRRRRAAPVSGVRVALVAGSAPRRAVRVPVPRLAAVRAAGLRLPIVAGSAPRRTVRVALAYAPRRFGFPPSRAVRPRRFRRCRAVRVALVADPRRAVRPRWFPASPVPRFAEPVSPILAAPSCPGFLRFGLSASPNYPAAPIPAGSASRRAVRFALAYAPRRSPASGGSPVRLASPRLAEPSAASRRRPGRHATPSRPAAGLRSSPVSPSCRAPPSCPGFRVALVADPSGRAAVWPRRAAPVCALPLSARLAFALRRFRRRPGRRSPILAELSGVAEPRRFRASPWSRRRRAVRFPRLAAIRLAGSASRRAVRPRRSPRRPGRRATPSRPAAGLRSSPVPGFRRADPRRAVRASGGYGFASPLSAELSGFRVARSRRLAGLRFAELSRVRASASPWSPSCPPRRCPAAPVSASPW
jgi:hypothetical protein